MNQKITIKYVKKAQMWCKTTHWVIHEGKIVKRKQKQEWSNEKPDEKS